MYLNISVLVEIVKVLNKTKDIAIKTKNDLTSLEVEPGASGIFPFVSNLKMTIRRVRTNSSARHAFSTLRMGVEFLEE